MGWYIEAEPDHVDSQEWRMPLLHLRNSEAPHEINLAPEDMDMTPEEMQADEADWSIAYEYPYGGWFEETEPGFYPNRFIIEDESTFFYPGRWIIEAEPT